MPHRDGDVTSEIEASPPDRDDPEPGSFVEQRLQTFAEQARVGVSGSVSISLLVTLMLWEEVPRARLLGFLLAVASTIVARTVSTVAFTRKRHVASLETWERVFTAVILFTGLVWGLSGCLVVDTFVQRTIVTAGLFFLAAGASHYTLPRALPIQLTIAALVIPIGLRFAAHDTLADRGMALLTLALVAFGARIIRQTTDNARLTHTLSVQLNAARREAESLANVDSLTGLSNRRAFYATGERFVRLADRYEEPLSLVLLDVDRFKKINDTRGHAVGDKVLRAIGALLQRTCRESDLAGRLGGEEFAVLLPKTSTEGAQIIAERLRQAIEAELVDDGEGGTLQATASLGVAELDGRRSLDALIAHADSAMYRAKEGGRNRVVLAELPAEQEEADASTG